MYLIFFARRVYVSEPYPGMVVVNLLVEVTMTILADLPSPSHLSWRRSNCTSVLLLLLLTLPSAETRCQCPSALHHQSFAHYPSSWEVRIMLPVELHRVFLAAKRLFHFSSLPTLLGSLFGGAGLDLQPSTRVLDGAAILSTAGEIEQPWELNVDPHQRANK
uniref:Uncharacterized protein n=1 Tax=Sphaerodactylus townsendi TaxID=933632 RepID=A0ACB8G073_9SAUR